MRCEQCGKEVTKVGYKNKKWICKICSPDVFTIPGYLHESAGNKWAPKLTKAKQNVFARSIRLSSGDVIDTATGKEPAY